jgi:hypothetical protein
MKVAMIIPRKKAQTIGLSRLKGFKSTRISRMTLQGREEGFNKGVIRGSTGPSKGSQYMDGSQCLAQQFGFHRAPPVTDDLSKGPETRSALLNLKSIKSGALLILK